MKKYLFILPLVALALMCSCEKKAVVEETEELVWGTASVCLENPIAEGESRCYLIELKLDTLSGESELAKSVADMIRDSVMVTSSRPTIQATLAAFADSLDAEWKVELAERYEPEAEWKDIFQYYFSVEGKPVEESREGIMSYETKTTSFVGGAHGSYEVHYYNFEKESGKLLNVKDVIPAEKEADVLKEMEKQLCRDWEAWDLTELQETTGITMLGDVFLTNNFLLKGSDSIMFLFNQYEIAPYSAGLISVTIPLPKNP